MLSITGYTDRLSVSPGETIEFKISSSHSKPYHASLIKILYADPNPEGPGIQEEDLSNIFSSTFPSRRQPVHPGSYGRVDGFSGISAIPDFTVYATIFPTMPDGDIQGIVGTYDATAQQGVSLGIDAEKGLFVCAGEIGELCLRLPLRKRRWYRVWLSYDSTGKRLSVGQLPLKRAVGFDDEGTAEIQLSEPLDIFGPDSFLIAALNRRPAPFAHFNGKIERPGIVAATLSEKEIRNMNGPVNGLPVIADWRFCDEMNSMRFTDHGPNALHGKLVNAPARAVKGSNWNGKEMCWRHAPDQYDAIHFHDDDIYDCGWDTDFSFEAPENLPGGIYAMRIECDREEDVIPFYITPGTGNRRNDICVLIPTLTYILYGNHARAMTDKAYLSRANDWGARTATPDNTPGFGLSTYNFHSDGSGIAYASRLRPMINFRPNYLTFAGESVGSGVHHFGADLYLLSWLEEKGYTFDIITDEDLHANGVSLIDGYRVLLTTSHPEYCTKKMLDGLCEYTNHGHMMYLGGNGFYWRVANNENLPGLFELRRNETGIRAWHTEPGEYYHSLDGSYGGLWRQNDRTPQSLVGVGFSAQGGFIGSYYRRTERSYENDVCWVFEGIDEEIVGDFGLAGGGAAGYELDRADISLGTPENCIILASSENHGDSFELVYEDRLWGDKTITGEDASFLVRADMVCFESIGGGMVFSAGSITYTGSLPCNNYNNNISTITRNVLNRFLRGSAGN